MDPFYALALAVTASRPQVRFLRDLIDKHLNFHASIGVDIWVRLFLHQYMDIY